MTASIRNFSRVCFLLAIDATAFYGSLTAAFFARKSLTFVVPSMPELRLPFGYFLEIWWLPAIFLFFTAYEGLYFRNLSFWDETHDLVQAVTVSTITILAVLTIGRMSPDISRLVVILLWLCGLFLFPFFRLMGKRLLFKTGIWQENVIIIGAGRAGTDAVKAFQSEAHLGYHVLGFLDDDDDKIGTDLLIAGKRYRVFGKTKNFSKFVKMLNISTIIVAIPSLHVEKLTELTRNIQKYAKNILLIPDLKGIALTNTELNHLFFQQLFLLKINNNLKSLHNRVIKRTFDMGVSVLLLPLLLPLIGILGLLIKLDSRGPVFYRHARIGRGGKEFGVYKFRSMHQDSKERLETILQTDAEARKEWDTYFKLKNDPRITAMGRFLRRTSLDELPQIFNVLKSEMSLVGPRPVIEEELVKYYKEGADYYQLVRPGITGLWQVSGRNDVDYEARVKLDTWYVLNWSLWLDMLMLVRTVKVVFRKQGAY